MTATPRPPASARRVLALAILSLELVVVGLAGVTQVALGHPPAATVWTLTGGLMAVGVGAMLLLPTPAGYVLGWLLQVGIIAAGVSMDSASTWVLGLVFLLVWSLGERKGVVIDRERRHVLEQARAADTLEQ